MATSSCLAYKLSKEPGKGQKYYKLPDPISATGVCKFFRLTRTLIDIAASNTFLGVPHGVETDFELDHEETDQVCQWSRDPTPTLLLGRGGTGKTLIILQSLWRKYQLAVEEGGGGVVVFVTGSNVLRNTVREAFIGLRHAYHGIEPTDAPPASLLGELCRGLRARVEDLCADTNTSPAELQSVVDGLMLIAGAVPPSTS